MMKWKISKSWRKRKEKMKMKKVMVWVEEMRVRYGLVAGELVSQ